MNNGFKGMTKRVLTGLMAGAMLAVYAVPAMAAQEDVIDRAQTGSITIHKYDITAAEKDGISTSGYTAVGKKDAQAEADLAAYAIEGVEFSYLKVSDIVTDSENGDVGVVYEIEDDLRDALSLTEDEAALIRSDGYYYTMQELNDALETLLSDNTSGKNVLEDYIQSSGDAQAMDLTDEDGVTAAQNLDLGLYLVVETEVPDNVVYTCNPFFVSVPTTDAEGDEWFYDVDVYPKNQTDVPTLNKKVKADDESVYSDSTTASGGEQLSYIMVSRLPKITSGATDLTVYTFRDEMSKGLEYTDNISLHWYKDAKAAAKNDTSKAVKTWKTDDAKPKFTVAYTGSSATGSTMTVTMTRAGLNEINPDYSRMYVVVDYTVNVVTGDALVLGDEGNPNDVTLEWRRTSDTYYDTMKDECIVYAFGIDLTKTFSKGSGDFSKVEFVLQNKTDGQYLTASGSNGVYCLSGKSENEDGATHFIPDSNGSLVVRELEADDYELTEVKTASGYSLLADPVEVELTCTSKTITPSEAEITGTPNYTDAESYYAASGNKTRKFVEVVTDSHASAKVDDSAAEMADDQGSSNALVEMSVLNSPEALLPKTGGSGLYIVTIIGMVFAAAGVFFMTHSSRREEEK